MKLYFCARLHGLCACPAVVLLVSVAVRVCACVSRHVNCVRNCVNRERCAVCVSCGDLHFLWCMARIPLKLGDE